MSTYTYIQYVCTKTFCVNIIIMYNDEGGGGAAVVSHAVSSVRVAHHHNNNIIDTYIMSCDTYIYVLQGGRKYDKYFGSEEEETRVGRGKE